MVSCKQARVDSRKYFIFQYQENVSMTQSQALAKAASEGPLSALAWSFTLGKLDPDLGSRDLPGWLQRHRGDLLWLCWGVNTDLHNSAPQWLKLKSAPYLSQCIFSQQPKATWCQKRSVYKYDLFLTADLKSHSYNLFCCNNSSSTFPYF